MAATVTRLWGVRGSFALALILAAGCDTPSDLCDPATEDCDDSGDSSPTLTPGGDTQDTEDVAGDDASEDGPDDTADTAQDTDSGYSEIPDYEVDLEDDVDFYFELAYLDPEKDAPFDFQVDVRSADIAFNMDTTGSMGGSIRSLQSSLTTILIPSIAASVPDTAFSFSQFDDFPCEGHGSGADLPFRLRQRVTTDLDSAIAGVQSLELHYGGDTPESGIESIFQICTGFGRDGNCSNSDGARIPAFNPTENLVPGVADGTIGGVGFRQGSLPVIVHITDAPSHSKGQPSSNPYRYGASRPETYQAMRRIGARVIGIASSSSARSDLETIAIESSSVVATCAWTDPVTGERPYNCAEGFCCTGVGGAGIPPISGACPLVYDYSSSGEGLGPAIVSGVQGLVNFASFDLTAIVRRDPDEPDVDTSEFIRAVIPVTSTPPAISCARAPELVDRNGDGVVDHFSGVQPGTALEFMVVAENRVFPGAATARVFRATIDIVQQGGAVLDTRQVVIVVPPSLKPIR